MPISSDTEAQHLSTFSHKDQGYISMHGQRGSQKVLSFGRTANSVTPYMDLIDDFQEAQDHSGALVNSQKLGFTNSLSGV